MRKLNALLAFALAAAAGAAHADHHMSGTAPWTSTVCGAGPDGARAAGVDADGDGVADSNDWCPNSDRGERVNADGCASWQVPVQCTQLASEAAPMRVVPVAPPAGAQAPLPRGTRDADKDGVADEADKCPGTPRGTEVDRNGCAIISKVVLKGVNFATGSSKLLPAASDTLKAVAGAMQADKSINVEIGGYTDSVGEEARNQALSERRAKSVKTFLVHEGVAADRLTTRGYGESNPVDTNDTAAGRANNRRVTFRVR